MKDNSFSALIVGAGPAGLATSHELQRRNVDHVVLERGHSVGYTWTKLYDSLTLHTGKHLSSLPGLPFPSSTPLFPSREQFINYLRHYAQTFRLPIQTGSEVLRANSDGSTWILHTKQGKFSARCLVMASGILSNPHRPNIPHQERFNGQLIHSVDYKRPNAYIGRRVLVVGVGNSGGEISSELAHAGAEVTVAVRSGAMVLPLKILGIPIQYFGYLMARLPWVMQKVITTAAGKVSQRSRGLAVLPPPNSTLCPDVPLIGFHMVDAIRKGRIRARGALHEFTDTGVLFNDGSAEDFDDVIMATGYRAALGVLRGYIRLDDCGFALREGRVVSRDHPNLFFVGHNYDATGGLVNISRDSKIVARMILAKK